MSRKWHTTRSGNCWSVHLPAKMWGAATHANMDPSPASLTGTSLGSPTYDRVDYFSFGQPTGVNAQMSVIDIDILLPDFVRGWSGGVSAFAAFQFHWFTGGDSSAAMVNWFTSMKMITGLGYGAVLWSSVVSCRSAGAGVYVPVISPVCNFYPAPSFGPNNPMRIRVGRQRSDGGNLDTWASNANFVGGTLYLRSA